MKQLQGYELKTMSTMDPQNAQVSLEKFYVTIQTEKIMFSPDHYSVLVLEDVKTNLYSNFRNLNKRELEKSKINHATAQLSTFLNRLYFFECLFDRVREEYDAQTFKRGKDCVIYLSQDTFTEKEV